jgi:hypothetical protein
MDGRDKLEKLRHALAKSREENKKKRKEKKEENEKTLKQVIDELIIIQKRKPVVGSLERKKKIWRKKLVVQKLMWEILEIGAPLMFHQKKPKPRRIRNMFMNEKTLTILDRYVAEQIEEKFVEETQDELKLVSLMFVIPKREPGE